MPELAIDLSAGTFWAFTLFAILLVLPIASETGKRWTLAALNLCFVDLIAGHGAALAALGCVGVVYVLLRRSQRPRSRQLVAVALGLAAGAAFVLHKIALDAAAAIPVKTALSAIGYSYVFLRVIDLLRSFAEAPEVVPGPVSLINYLLPFHMLAAGPIQAYDEFAGQPSIAASLSVRGALDGVDRIARGLFKKFVLAESLSTVFLNGFHQGGAYFLVEMQVFYVWVFLDFSAYSDIAVGIGRLLGIATPENFNRPLLARNLIDFWERWHISLSQFIRRNLFIPIQLALMRRTEGRHPLAIASVAFSVSFLLCGLWHGLTLRFLLWGAMHALGLVVCNAYKHWLLRRLGRKRMNAYLQDWRIRVVATFLTAEFVALSLAMVVYPFHEVSQ